MTWTKSQLAEKTAISNIFKSIKLIIAMSPFKLIHFKVLHKTVNSDDNISFLKELKGKTIINI
jgi:hypothetical protein